MDMKLQRIIITWTLVLISTVVTLAQTTGLYTYDGGYFIKNGNSWEEYRPDFQEGIWATYEQYNEEAHFYNIQNSQCVVSVPKSAVNKFYYAKPGEEWQPIYNTKEIYEYMPDSGREIYCYQGGYFVRDGLTWREYRPGTKHELWASYEQKSANEYFFFIGNENNDVAIPRSDSGESIFLSKDGNWTPIYSMTGIYDGAKGYEYSLEFKWWHAYDAERMEYGDSVSRASRVCFNSDGRGEVRYSGNRFPFQAKAFNLYEKTRFIDQDPLIGFLFGFSAPDEGFVFYGDEDGFLELLTYVDDSDGGICVLHRIPGMEKAKLSGCRNTDVGEKIHSMIEENLPESTELCFLSVFMFMPKELLNNVFNNT